jgi:hypothetical protein
MLKFNIVVPTLVASLLALAAVACGAPSSSESSESSESSALDVPRFNPCAFYAPVCTPGGHTECIPFNPDAGNDFRGACPAIGDSCEPAGAPCSVDNLPAGATTASCVQAAAFPGQVAPWTCLAN